mmetsp:Transcript_21858/g.32183  ORF Transcript_21858/g.32183 Transcript_21858/m.32183 type:complete len:87 (-) Transcript_21858:38-298(-)
MCFIHQLLGLQLESFRLTLKTNKFKLYLNRLNSLAISETNSSSLCVLNSYLAKFQTTTISFLKCRILCRIFFGIIVTKEYKARISV